MPHPGFVIPHLGDAWAGAVFTTFLGRAPRVDEIRSMRPLAAVFSARSFCDGAMDRFSREACVYYPDPAACLAVQETDCMLARRFEGTISYCACTYTAGGCVSDALGTRVDLGTGPCGDEIYSGEPGVADPYNFRDCIPAMAGYLMANGAPANNAPDRAQRLRREQGVRDAGLTATHVIALGDRAGSADAPRLREDHE